MILVDIKRKYGVEAIEYLYREVVREETSMFHEQEVKYSRII